MMRTQTQTVIATEKTVTLQPLAMVIPTREGIYAPSRIRPKKVVGLAEFMAKFADHPRPVLVSFAPDGKSHSRRITAYGFGLDCWYLVVPEDKSTTPGMAVVA